MTTRNFGNIDPPGHPITLERAGRYRGCLLGGAAGDALGAPVEFLDRRQILGRFGPAGIRDFAPAYGGLGRITDDTQMTLFTAEGLLRHQVSLGAGQDSTVEEQVAHAYQRWLLTQGLKSRAGDIRADGWLFGHPSLFSVRSPGNTCISALAARDHATDCARVDNHSKGCGGVMRAAPVGLYACSLHLDSEQAFDWGCRVAGLTHGHPTGQLPAGVLAMMVAELAGGAPLPRALAAAKAVLRRRWDHEETLAALEDAETLALGPTAGPAALGVLGQGWVAEEALAVALFCALRAESLEEGLVMAVNITGDSDSTGAITGNLLGAALGAQEIPVRWLAQLELREVLETVADDLAAAGGWRLGETPSKVRNDEEQAHGSARYPPG